MKLAKKLSALLLALAMTASLAACGSQGDASSAASGSAAGSDLPAESVTVRVAALKGPTAMGLAQLMGQSADTEGKETGASAGDLYDFTLAASADEVTPALLQGDLDVACVPANLAAVLYQKTQGQIVTLAVNTLGVLYLVENGNAVASLADLKGKTIVAAGKGSTPEYALRYLLTENGFDPDTDLTIDWKSEHSECVAALAQGAATIALLPQPFVTVAQGKIEGLRMALDLTAEWESVSDAQLVQGCLVVRKAFADEHPEALKAFLKEYAASAKYAVDSPSDAGALVEKYGIMASAALAEKAIPNCNIVCITGEEMQVMVSGMLKVLFDANPKSVGGKLPGDDMFYLG